MRPSNKAERSRGALLGVRGERCGLPFTTGVSFLSFLGVDEGVVGGSFATLPFHRLGEVRFEVTGSCVELSRDERADFIREASLTGELLFEGGSDESFAVFLFLLLLLSGPCCSMSCASFLRFARLADEYLVAD